MNNRIIVFTMLCVFFVLFSLQYFLSNKNSKPSAIKNSAISLPSNSKIQIVNNLQEKKNINAKNDGQTSNKALVWQRDLSSQEGQKTYVDFKNDKTNALKDKLQNLMQLYGEKTLEVGGKGYVLLNVPRAVLKVNYHPVLGAPVESVGDFQIYIPTNDKQEVISGFKVLVNVGAGKVAYLTGRLIVELQDAENLNEVISKYNLLLVSQQPQINLYFMTTILWSDLETKYDQMKSDNLIKDVRFDYLSERFKAK